MPVGEGISQFWGEAQDPPQKLIAKDGDVTPIFKAAMENSQSPEQTTKDIAIATTAHALRNPPATETAAKQMTLALIDQLKKAANIPEEGKEA